MTYSTQSNISDFTAYSAGIRALVGEPIHPNASLALRNLGGDASHFAARQFTAKTAADADLVLTMTEEHRAAVLEIVPRLLHRTFTMSEAACLALNHAQSIPELSTSRPQLTPLDQQDIPDPIGQDPDFFGMVAARIAGLLPPILQLHR